MVPIKSSDAVTCSFADSIGSSFPVPSHRCHHKQKHCPPALSGGGLPATPLLFHPHTKGSQILMDLSHKAVKRQASFCNAITFSNRPVLIYEQVRLKVGTPGSPPLTSLLPWSAVPLPACPSPSCPSLILPPFPAFLGRKIQWERPSPTCRKAPWGGRWVGMSRVSFLAVGRHSQVSAEGEL